MECEARGLPEEYPVGMIYGSHSKVGDLYWDITFAIAENNINKHANFPVLWACRDSGYGDNVGDQKCGGSNSFIANEYWADINIAAPHFKRMAAWLLVSKIPATVWDGEKPVPLWDWLAQKGVTDQHYFDQEIEYWERVKIGEAKAGE